MTAAEFRSRVLSILPNFDSARLIDALPAKTSAQVLTSMTDPEQLADILSWMGEVERQRAMLVTPPLVLRKAHRRLGIHARDRLKGSESLAFWDDIARVKDYEIQAWAHDLSVRGPDATRQLWADLDCESRARIVLIMPDEHLNQLQEILK